MTMKDDRNKSDSLDLSALQARFEGREGKRFWRSLEELAGSPRYRDFLHQEFPRHLEPEQEGVNRRDVLKLMAASAALAGLTACTKMPAQKIVPYVRAPEEIIPGKPLFYATAMPLGGVAKGVLVESHMGRPTKVEGNPDHPASLGATDIFAQASVLTLYDPDRSQVVTHEGRVANWSLLLRVLNDARDEHRSNQGAGLRVLTENVTSLTLGEQLQTLLKEFPLAKWHEYEPCGWDAARQGSRLAFGEYVNTVYRFDRAEAILSLDADFLGSGPGSVRYARDFAATRHVGDKQDKMSRLYVVESTPSNTGAMADHRLPLRSVDVGGFARIVAGKVGARGGSSHLPVPSGVSAEWIGAVARDLERHQGSSLVLAGDGQPPVVHALAHAMNEALGNVGKTVLYTEPLEVNPVDQIQSLRELVSEMQAGQVETLVILGSNPVYTTPADFEFGKHLLNVKLRIHLGLYEDETAELCHWHVPETHFLESWSDARAYDGSVTILQPLIAPLYDGKSPHELLAVLLGRPDATAHDVVKEYWQRKVAATRPASLAGFDALWQTSLHNGLVAGSALPEKRVTLKASDSDLGVKGKTEDASGNLEIVFRPDPAVWDGRFANNGWLQELPKPLTQLTWDNAALMSVSTALRLGVSNEDIVELSYQGRALRAPVWIAPGHANDSVTVHCGYGRRRAGRLGTGIGFDAYTLRVSQSPGFGAGLKVRKTGERYQLAATQFHHVINLDEKAADEPSVEAFRRDLIRVGTLEEFQKNPNFAKDPEEKTSKALTLYPGFKYAGYAWGMAIDLNCCTGCNACVVACQSENNIPVVGKDQVQAGREMHWIRIDTYFRGGLENPETYHEPVLCMQCENAPCEGVCPVAATVHSPEGLNEMVYNRCVGTRYCSNNCPYKVRRFNFKLYSDWTTDSLKPLRNPNVTVRSRGVMEKCTYCVQRINASKIESEKQGRAVRDGEIVTACEGACPAQAIVFGNINDPESRVSKLKAQSRNYGLLTELNTRPRTTYLARLRNPNPEIKD